MSAQVEASGRPVAFGKFRPLAGLPLGMTAHVVFSALDPVAPARLTQLAPAESQRRH